MLRSSLGCQPLHREEGSGNIAIPALSRCPECGHDQSDHSVVKRLRFTSRALDI